MTKRSGQPYFTDTQFERIAVEELASANLLPAAPGPIRIERFVEKRFKLSAVTYDELPPGVLGYTEFGPAGVTGIFVARLLADAGSRMAERRINSTLAHEAGHGLLHAHLFALDSFPRELFDATSDVSTVRILCRDEPAAEKRDRAYDGRWWEVQANRMIGCMLMPKPLVLTAIAPHLTLPGCFAAPSLPASGRELAARELAAVFDVNPAVARIRLSHLFPEVQTSQLTL